MQRLTPRIIAKLVNTGLWFCFCLAAFWGEWGRVFLFGIPYGIVIWSKADTVDSRVSPRTDAVIAASFHGVVIVLILVFHVGTYPLVAALIAAALGAAVVHSKLLPHQEP